MILFRQPEKKHLSMDNIQTIFDNFGRFQIVQYIFISIPIIFVSMMNVNYVFVAGEVAHRCVIPKCEGTSPSVERPSWWPDGATECERPTLDPVLYQHHNNTCTKHAFNNDTVKCTRWVYENQDSIVSEMNLACQSWKAFLVGTVHNSGMLVVTPFTGWLTDRFGRKPCIIVCVVGSCFGLIKSFLNSYNWYIAVEFIESVIAAGVHTACSVLLIEVAGQKNRVLCGLVFAYAIYMGEAIFACIAMAVPYWRSLVQIIYAPPILFLSYIWLLYESPKWQMITGKVKNAKHIITVIAKTNNMTVSNQEITNTSDEDFRNKFNLNEQNSKKAGYGQILRSKEVMKRLFVATYWRFTVSFVYYSLLVNSVSLPGNKYTNFIMSALMSFPGEVLSFFFMRRFGRRLPLMGGFLFCGALCIALAFTPESLPWLKTTLFVLSKLMVAMCYTGISTYTLEMFPTSARGSIVGICTVFEKIGMLLSPLTPLLGIVTLASLFGAFVILAGALVTLTPETRNTPLPDTIEQVEAARNKK